MIFEKGDRVKVIDTTHKGHTGTVLQIDQIPPGCAPRPRILVHLDGIWSGWFNDADLIPLEPKPQTYGVW
jgi:hypothetical protein